jgi:hypothetical protein
MELFMTDPVVNAADAAVSAVKADVNATVTKQLGFFERNPKATAIGSAIAGALLVLLATVALHAL